MGNYNYERRFNCDFCDFWWGDKYLGGGEREDEQERIGNLCPKCGLIQWPDVPCDPWRQEFRKFIYGYVNPNRRKEVEAWIADHFEWKQDHERKEKR